MQYHDNETTHLMGPPINEQCNLIGKPNVKGGKKFVCLHRLSYCFFPEQLTTLIPMQVG